MRPTPSESGAAHMTSLGLQLRALHVPHFLWTRSGHTRQSCSLLTCPMSEGASDSKLCGMRRCADFVLLNKIDLLKEGQLESLKAIVASLNPFATVSVLCYHERPAHLLQDFVSGSSCYACKARPVPAHQRLTS